MTRLGAPVANSALQARLREAEDAYRTANPLSRQAHLAATGPLPGGNTRSILHFSPFP